MAYVYRHRKRTNDEIFYIGIGSDSNGKYTRAYATYGRHRNLHWKNVVNKHGYYVEITHDNIIWEEACSIEKYLILFYGRRDLKTGALVNKTGGGEGFIDMVVSAETRKKISDSRKGEKHFWYGKHLPLEIRKKISESNKGRIISQSQRDAISKSMMGKPAYNKGLKMPVSQYVEMVKRAEKIQISVAKYSIDGAYICMYYSIIKAAKLNSLNQGNITNACNNKIMYGGYLWRYIQKGVIPIVSPYNVRVKKVLQYDLSGNLVKEYSSCLSAAQQNGWVKSTILRAVKRENNIAYNFKWAIAN